MDLTPRPVCAGCLKKDLEGAALAAILNQMRRSRRSPDLAAQLWGEWAHQIVDEAVEVARLKATLQGDEQS